MDYFKDDIKKAINSVTETEVNYVLNYIENIIVPYIKKLQNANPTLNIADFKKKLEEESFALASTAFKSSTTFDGYMQYMCCLYFQDHPEIFDEYYENFKNNNINLENFNIYLPTNNNFSDYLNHYIQHAYNSFEKLFTSCEEALKKIPNLNSILQDETIDITEKMRQSKTYINRNISSKGHREHLTNLVTQYLKGFKKYLEIDEQLISKPLQRRLVDSINSTKQQLDKLNVSNRYCTIEEKNFKKIGFQDYISCNKNINLSNPESLRNLSIHDLMILNSFWINRYAKELELYAKSIFLVNTFALIPDILNNTFDINNLDPAKVSTALTKCYMLKNSTAKYLNDKRKAFSEDKLSEDEYSIDDSGNFITFSFVPLADSLSDRHSNKYEKWFNLLLPDCDNQLQSNVLLYSPLISPVLNIYNMKDKILNGLIANLGNNKEIVNCGIIPDSILPDNSAIIVNSNLICIGLDVKKLSFPVREHVILPALKEFLTSLQNGNEFIPIYEGNDDLKFPDGRNISAQQILPISKEQEKLLRKSYKELNGFLNSGFVEHMYWLQNPKSVPEKFQTIYKDAKGRMKLKYVKKYVCTSDIKRW